jgi:hypothetical protein
VRRFDQRALRGRAVGAGLGEAGRDDHETTRAGRGRVGHGRSDCLRRYGDQRQINRTGGLRGRPVGRKTSHALGSAMNGDDRAAVPAIAEVAQHRRADALAAGARAVDRDRARADQAGDRPRLGAVLAALLHLAGLLGRGDREAQMHHAIGVLALDLISGVAEDAQHAAVVREHLGDEPGDAVLASGIGQVLEQDGSDAPALVRVLDHERHLGFGRVGSEPLVPSNGHDPWTADDHQRFALPVIDVDEPFEVARGDAGVRREVAQVPGPIAHPGVELHDGRRVLRADLAHVDGASVREQYVRALLHGHLLNRGGRTGRDRAAGRPPSGSP